MECLRCPFYKTGFDWNHCKLLQMDCFSVLTDCVVVNSDGTPSIYELDKMGILDVDFRPERLRP